MRRFFKEVAYLKKKNYLRKYLDFKISKTKPITKEPSLDKKPIWEFFPNFSVFFWKRLLTGTVPVNNSLLTGTVPVNNFLLTGTVPVNNSLLTGTGSLSIIPY